MSNKQSIAKINRWIGWLCVPVTLAAFVTRYVLYWNDKTGPNYGTYVLIQTLVGILPLIHGLISIYIFGIPRSSNSAKVRHVYIGYAVLLLILISQSIPGLEPFYTILTIGMYVAILYHTILGLKHAMARNSDGDSMAELHRGARRA